MKNLVLFTMNYPFGHGEHWIGNEIPYLINQFSNVTVVCNDVHSIQNYAVPEGVKVIRKNFLLSHHEKREAILGLFSTLFWREIFSIFRTYHRVPTKSDIVSILLHIRMGNTVRMFIESEVFKNESPSCLVLYSWWTTEVTFGFTLIKRKFPQIKTVTRAHAIDLYFERHQTGYLPMRNHIYSKLDNIYCISDHGKTYIHQLLANNAIDQKVEVSKVGSINRYKVDVQHNPITKEKIVVSCSNLIPLKRVHLIVEALSDLENLRITWYHFGDGHLKPELEGLAGTLLDSKQNISYQFMGYAKNEELLKFYDETHVDLFLNVSEYEGIPVTIMEAMSFGVPTIATNVGGVNEIVSDLNGFLMDNNLKSEELSSQIAYFFNLDAETIQSYRSQARLTWEKDYNADANYKKLARRIAL